MGCGDKEAVRYARDGALWSVFVSAQTRSDVIGRARTLRASLQKDPQKFVYELGKPEHGNDGWVIEISYQLKCKTCGGKSVSDK